MWCVHFFSAGYINTLNNTKNISHNIPNFIVTIVTKTCTRWVAFWQHGRNNVIRMSFSPIDAFARCKTQCHVWSGLGQNPNVGGLKSQQSFTNMCVHNIARNSWLVAFFELGWLPGFVLLLWESRKTTLNTKGGVLNNIIPTSNHKRKHYVIISFGWFEWSYTILSQCRNQRFEHHDVQINKVRSGRPADIPPSLPCVNRGRTGLQRNKSTSSVEGRFSGTFSRNRIVIVLRGCLRATLFKQAAAASEQIYSKKLVAEGGRLQN